MSIQCQMRYPKQPLLWRRDGASHRVTIREGLCNDDTLVELSDAFMFCSMYYIRHLFYTLQAYVLNRLLTYIMVHKLFYFEKQCSSRAAKMSDCFY